MPELRALIFDVDGTLADTEEIHRHAFNVTFEEFGLGWEWTPRIYRELLRISGGRERMHAYAESLAGAYVWPRNPSEYFRRIHRVKTAHYARLLAEGNVQLRPGVLRLLGEARERGLRLALATSSALSNVHALLGHHLGGGWSQWFDAIVTCDVVETKKPSPAVYEYALRALRLDAWHCVAFEDTENGNLAARSAGLPTIITTHYYTRAAAFPGASLVVDHLGEPDQPFVAACGGELADAGYVDLRVLRRIVASAAADALASEGTHAA